MNKNVVKNDNYYSIPSIHYNWITQPPSVNRILGIKWLGNLIYSEIFQYDMIEKAKTFYNLFYHYDLSDAEARELMPKSSFF